jgi:lipoic acid synthetase
MMKTASTPENRPRPRRTPKPPWLKRRLPSGPAYEEVRDLLNRQRLHTVCQEALCPNLWECFSRRTSTFLIMGPTCSRSCTFCAVKGGGLQPLDPGEPERVAETAARLGLRYVVVTSVTRDDLPDGGAGHFAATIAAIRAHIPSARLEVLIPDFQGDREALRTVVAAAPDVLNHNIETVPRLYPTARPEADYRRSLALLRQVSDIAPRVPTKSGLMLGLGETGGEIRQTLLDLRDARCRILTMGQYLQPSRAHMPVVRFVAPCEFDRWRESALEMGFAEVASGPLVRSSYHAAELFGAVAAGSGQDR